MPPQPFNLGNWMMAYQASQIEKANEPKVEIVEEKYEGGWKAEGKEKPVTPRVCTRCQWYRKNEQQEEPDKENWCDSCLEGKPGIGHEPDKSYRPPAPKVGDRAVMNQTFFG